MCWCGELRERRAHFADAEETDAEVVRAGQRRRAVLDHLEACVVLSKVYSLC